MPGLWKRVEAGCVTIQVCDLSADRDRLSIDAGEAVGIAGRPVMSAATAGGSEELRTLATDLRAGRLGALESANGVFCGFRLDRERGSLELFTDYLGFEKIWLARMPWGLAFANAQWLVEHAAGPGLRLSPDDVIDLAVHQHPMGDRTRWQEVRLLPPGTLMRLDAEGGEQRIRFADLLSTRPWKCSHDEALDAVHHAWRQAVADRIEPGSRQHAFLSGGMDSRLVVHTLHALGADVATANFAPAHTRDCIYALDAAAAIGVPVYRHPSGSHLLLDVVTDTVRRWAREGAGPGEPTRLPRIWSGDGGSVGLGHVYLDDEIERFASAGDFAGCARAFATLNRRTPVVRAYRDADVHAAMLARLTQALERCAGTDPGRAPYLFLMLHDQRHHLRRHQERLHERGFEFVLPFLDRRLVTLVASLPGKWFNLHRMYHRLYEHVGGTLVQTPWQTYPGHVPCPIPDNRRLAGQWERGFYARSDVGKRRRADALKCLRFALDGRCASLGLRRGVLAAGAISTLLGVGDRSYLVNCLSPALD